MKIVHTGDWHIGKIVNEFSMIKDQEYVLNKLIEIIDKEKADVLVIAGDIYDRSIPPVEAVELLNNVLNKLLIKRKIKILAISGNHDSGERLGFGSGILEQQGLYISGKLGTEIKPIELNDAYGKINFYLIPYVDPSVVRNMYSDSSIKTHNDAMKYIINKIENNMDLDSRNILVAHGYVTLKRNEAIECNNEEKYSIADLEVSDSERPLSIGGTDLIDGTLFEKFDYVALGHLHGRQKVGKETIRYSGSLMKYSFSEINHKKGVTIVNIDGQNNIDVNQVEIEPLHNMRIIKGELQSLINSSYKENQERNDYIQAILTDEGEIIDPIGKLRTVYPNIMLLKREERKSIDENMTSASDGYKSKSELDLFKEFYNRLGSNEFDDKKEKVIREIIDEILKKEV